MPQYVKVARVADLPRQGGKRVEVGGRAIGLFNVDGTIYAIDDTCTHAEASLCEGMVSGDEIICPLHAATFCLRTGEATGPPADEPLRTYELRIIDGDVEILI